MKTYLVRDLDFPSQSRTGTFSGRAGIFSMLALLNLDGGKIDFWAPGGKTACWVNSHDPFCCLLLFGKSLYSEIKLLTIIFLVTNQGCTNIPHNVPSLLINHLSRGLLTQAYVLGTFIREMVPNQR